MVPKKRVLLLVAIASGMFSGCGKPPEAPVAQVRGTVVGEISLPDSMRATRLLKAGCIQLVHRTSGEKVAEFSQSACPADPAQLLPEADIAFEASVEQNVDVLILRKDTVQIAEALAIDGQVIWRHLCQISDPTLPVDRYFAQVCRVEFLQGTGEKVGRFQSLRIATVEEIARTSDKETSALSAKGKDTVTRLIELERERQAIRRELESARLENESLHTSLNDAKRSENASIAAGTADRRMANRAKIMAELQTAEFGSEIAILKRQLAKADKEHAELLRRRLEDSDRAKGREDAIAKQIEVYQTEGRLATDEGKLLQAIFDQNRALILSAEERRRMEEQVNLAEAAASAIVKYSEEAAVFQLAMINKKNELNNFDRKPQTPTGE